MKKRITRHIENQDFVKLFIVDQDGFEITHFQGTIFQQNEKLLLMSDFSDFNNDGFVVVRKSDISEIKHTENEKFFKYILDKENITTKTIKRLEFLKFKLGGFKEMFLQLLTLKYPIIVECNYVKDDRFLIGQIMEIEDKKIKLKYFNAKGEFDFKLVSAKFKEVTFFRIDSPYANIFHKYSKEIE